MSLDENHADPLPYEPTDQELADLAALRALELPAPEPVSPTLASALAGIVPEAGSYPCRGRQALVDAGAGEPTFAGPKGEVLPRCPSRVELPGLCEACAVAVERQTRQTRIADVVRREIPRSFRWSRWDAPELVERTRRPVEQLKRIEAAFGDHGRGIFVGHAGSGKTSLACAWLRGVIGAWGNPKDARIFLAARPRFVAAKDLAAPSYLEGVAWIDLALSASALVLDDLGAELDGAAHDSGLAAQRRALVDRLIRSRHDRGLGTVVTTAIGTVGDHAKELARVYGDGIARRLLERAVVVRLGGAR